MNTVDFIVNDLSALGDLAQEGLAGESIGPRVDLERRLVEYLSKSSILLIYGPVQLRLPELDHPITLGIGGIGCGIASEGFHKVKPC